MRNLSFRTIIEKDGSVYHGSVPALRGCHTQGKTIEETRKNLREAILGYLKTLDAHNLTLPKDEGLEIIETVDFEQVSNASLAHA